MPGKGGIVAVERTGGAARFLIDDDRGPDRLLQEGDRLYAIYLTPALVPAQSPYSWAVGRVSKCGGGLVPIVTTADGIQDAAVDATWFYWIENGKVRRVPN
jgi:hypothetical protein